MRKKSVILLLITVCAVSVLSFVWLDVVDHTQHSMCPMAVTGADCPPDASVGGVLHHVSVLQNVTTGVVQPIYVYWFALVPILSLLYTLVSWNLFLPPKIQCTSFSLSFERFLHWLAMRLGLQPRVVQELQ